MNHDNEDEIRAEFTFDVDYRPQNIIMKVVASNVASAVDKIPALLSQVGLSGATLLSVVEL